VHVAVRHRITRPHRPPTHSPPPPFLLSRTPDCAFVHASSTGDIVALAAESFETQDTGRGIMRSLTAQRIAAQMPVTAASAGSGSGTPVLAAGGSGGGFGEGDGDGGDAGTLAAQLAGPAVVEGTHAPTGSAAGAPSATVGGLPPTLAGIAPAACDGDEEGGDTVFRSMSAHMPSLVDRYYTRMYTLDANGMRGCDQYVHLHSNRMTITGLAPSHPVVAGTRGVWPACAGTPSSAGALRLIGVEYAAAFQSDAMAAAVKKKKSGLFVEAGSVIAHAVCELPPPPAVTASAADEAADMAATDGASGAASGTSASPAVVRIPLVVPLRCSVVETNRRLATQPHLLVTKVGSVRLMKASLRHLPCWRV